MAFSELDLKRIDASAGDLCRRLNVKSLPHKIRYLCEVEGHTVTLWEERPAWNDPKSLTKQGIARFRYWKSRSTWQLFWMRRDLKWHAYDPEVSFAKTISPLVKVVEADKWSAFFG
jgi:hypothetical protein